jgi:hypothetical protein
MFCPLCKAEYREGFYRCADCGVALVNTLPQEAAGKASSGYPGGESAALLWSGADPVVYTTILNALEEAQIRYASDLGHDPRATGVSPFPSVYDSTGGFEIRVYRSDLPGAKRIVEGVLDREPEESPIKADAGDQNDSASAPEREIPEDWDPAAASAVVWSGNDEGMAQILSDCLRENGIASRSESDTSAHRLLVQPEDADAAREIVREVIEGTPPG